MNINSMLEFLRCPVSRQRVKTAGKNLLREIEKKRLALTLLRKSGQMVNSKSEIRLVTADQETFYPVVEGIPQLLGPEGISLRGIAFQGHMDTSILRHREPYAEMISYDNIAGRHMDAGDEESALGGLDEKDTMTKVMKANYTDTFPEPPQVWLDSKDTLLAQEAAYDYLTPLLGKRVLQVGGHGSHLIKFLLAGEREAWLVSPMVNELRRALSLSRRFGFEDRLFAVQGIAEEIPLLDSFFD